MENKIKITVEYDKPTSSKFDALMAQYVVAKNIADEIVDYYKPLADLAEEAKFDAIIEQLETIKQYAKRISAINNQAVWIKACLSAELRKSPYKCMDSYKNFEVIYRPNEGFSIMWSGDLFTKERLKKYPSGMCEKECNIIGKWDEWGVYSMLEESACKQLEFFIRCQNEKGEKQINRLKNIQGGI